MTPDSFVKAQLALLCWKNAPGGKPFSMLQCLAFIERNRVRAGWMGGDWLAVIGNDPAYSAYSGNGHAYSAGTGPVALAEFPDLRNEIFQKFLWEVDRIYDNSREDPMTEGALWWGETNKINRPWFLENISRKHERVAQVGAVTLWR